MKVEQTIMINGDEVVDSGQKIMGHRIFELTRDDDENTKYVVDNKGNVRSIIRIEADCSQNYGYVSEFSVEDVN
ncbi:hypothetical protein NVP1198B_29 [Vibrio phage 1.198.B._10N.286.54.F4]|nr:hypothetical protein NVP1198A_29 [Vibrio phage 1.198.A._10N.286.54.F4]AUR94817.1 hypothetical protein NVP1198B_29 [Vibrio phage 1.198.B._10N.286.54.F4]AUR99400.1 hypothetical protein NVP1265O_21 [Vibrio phage 1.265.O._10N.286.52.F6]